MAVTIKRPSKTSDYGYSVESVGKLKVVKYAPLMAAIDSLVLKGVVGPVAFVVASVTTHGEFGPVCYGFKSFCVRLISLELLLKGLGMMVSLLLSLLLLFGILFGVVCLLLWLGVLLLCYVMLVVVGFLLLLLVDFEVLLDVLLDAQLCFYMYWYFVFIISL